jgi:predicted metal-binding protein
VEKNNVSEAGPTRLYVCISCKKTGEGDGERLYEAARACLEAAEVTATGTELHPVTCFGNCEQGCSAAIAGPGKWGYLLGGLTPDLAGDLITYAGAYAASATGTVLRRARPASLERALLTRFPVPAANGGEEAFLKPTVAAS